MRYYNKVVLTGKIIEIEEGSDDIQSYYTLELSSDEYLSIMCIDELSSEVLSNITLSENVIIIGSLISCGEPEVSYKYALVSAEAVITEDGEVYTGEDNMYDVLTQILGL